MPLTLDPTTALAHFMAGHPRAAELEEGKRALKAKYAEAKRLGEFVAQARGVLAASVRAPPSRMSHISTHTYTYLPTYLSMTPVPHQRRDAAADGGAAAALAGGPRGRRRLLAAGHRAGRGGGGAGGGGGGEAVAGAGGRQGGLSGIDEDDEEEGSCCRWWLGVL